MEADRPLECHDGRAGDGAPAWPSPATLLRGLLAPALALAALTAALAIADEAGSAPDGYLAYTVNTGAEGNLAAWYSSALLLAAGLLAGLAGFRRRAAGARWGTHWLAVGALLVLASADEASQVHEQVPGPLRRALEDVGLGGTAGRLFAVVVVLAALAVIAAALLPWARSLSRPVLVRLAGAAALFVGSALGLEVVSRLLGVFGVDTVLTGRLLSAVEELGEMAGAALALTTILGVVAADEEGLLPAAERAAAGDAIGAARMEALRQA